MARATKIYIVWTIIGGNDVAAFTVKHECGKWLRKQSADYLDELRITTLNDGGAPGGSDTSSHDFLKERNTQ